MRLNSISSAPHHGHDKCDERQTDPAEREWQAPAGEKGPDKDEQGSRDERARDNDPNLLAPLTRAFAASC